MPPQPASTQSTRTAPDRERTAERLLASSAKLSFNPLKDVDWDADPIPGAYYCPPRHLSLYGTDLWERMTDEERIELSKHEVASIASVGIWFEEILMQMLLRHAFDRDPTSNHVQYALTEIADECRHSIMFARMIAKMGVPAYGAGFVAHNLGRLFKAISTHSQTFGGTMYVEEILDAFQREVMNDDTLQPLTRQVSRIHVIEEARHISYAREELVRKRLGPVRRRYEQLFIGLIVYYATTALIHPGCTPRSASTRRQAGPSPAPTRTGGPPRSRWRRRWSPCWTGPDWSAGPTAGCCAPPACWPEPTAGPTAR
ncbi:AurF N-oxygenase family protein [Kitasatospora fiedleri]|uniref:AurF N-oxygenase family protein n=1 Tax=Kitasatospora fiedleri TaxID=2991545 RepID=UPI00249CCE91|nr:diiron oxygenase [Kitasatospora fiedleri]